MGFIKKNLLKMEMSICALSIAMASTGVNFCRGMWYEPEIPEGMDAFMKTRKRK